MRVTATHASSEDKIKNLPNKESFDENTSILCDQLEKCLSASDTKAWHFCQNNEAYPILCRNYTEPDEWFILHHPTSVGMSIIDIVTKNVVLSGLVLDPCPLTVNISDLLDIITIQCPFLSDLIKLKIPDELKKYLILDTVPSSHLSLPK